MDETGTTPSPEHRRLGALLRKARKARGIRQAELAKMLGHQQAFVSKYEKGIRGLDAVDFLRILKLTGGDVAQIAAAVEVAEEEQPQGTRAARSTRRAPQG